MKPLTLVALLFVTAAASAQSTQAVKEFRLARSLTDKNLVEKPASLQITAPADGETTYAVDLAAGFAYIPPIAVNASHQTELGASAEYHRNTVTDKEQNSLILAATIAQIWGDISDPGTTTSWLPSAQLKYSKDQVKNTESIGPAADLRIANRTLRAGFIIGPKEFGFLWEPKVGLEYEQIIRATGSNPEGHVGRGYGSVDIAVYPFMTRFAGRLELVGTFRRWQDFAESSELDNGRDSHQLRRYSLNYFFDEDKHFGIGIDRVSGENPSEGLPHQRYTQLAFKVSF